MRRIRSITLYRDRDIRLETLPVVTFFQSCGVHVYVQDAISMDEYIKNNCTTTQVSDLSSSRVYTKLYNTTDFSIIIHSSLHPLECSDHIINDKYVEMNYAVGKNAFEVIDHILNLMLASIDEQINKYEDSDTGIPSYLREAFQDTMEMSCTTDYLMLRTPQFFDVIELYNNTAFFSIANTECINQLDKLTQTLTNPNDQGLRGLESFLPWKCLIEGLKYRSEIISRVFNPNSTSELFKFEPKFAITHNEFINWLSYGNYSHLPPDFMYENCITLHSDTDAYGIPDKEMMCGDMDYWEGLYQEARDHWRKCTRYTIDASFRIAKSYQKDMYGPEHISIRLSRKRSAATWYQEYLDKIKSDFEKGNITLIELYHIYVAMKHLSSVTYEDNQEFEFDWTPELEIRSSTIMRKINKYLTSYNIDQFDSNDIINAIILRYDKEFAVDRIDNDES